MSPTSPAFAVFWLGSVLAYNMTPRKHRLAVLVIASLTFCAIGSPIALGVLAGTSLIAFLAARDLSSAESTLRLWCWLGLLSAPLAIFKFQPSIAGLSSSGFQAALPLGISFFTFTAIAYVVDVSSRRLAPERSFARVAAHLAFFPKLLAGPIERAGQLLPQLEDQQRTVPRNFYVALKWVVWGLFCKLVVADNVGGVVDRLVSNPERESGLTLWLSFVLYSFQIYFDFSGYTSIAIGVARSFNIRLSANFDRPYLAASVRDFWHRWHISLSTWFRDYVYVPLGGSRTSGFRRFAQILAVFVLSGVWHGAAATFVLWGAFHGAAYWIEDCARRFAGLRRAERAGVPAFLRILGCALAFSVVTVGWTFFRLPDTETVSLVLGRMLGLDGPSYFGVNSLLLRADSLWFVGLLGSAILFDCRYQFRVRLDRVPRSRSAIAQELAYVNWCVLTLLLFGDLGVKDFTYFRF